MKLEWPDPLINIEIDIGQPQPHEINPNHIKEAKHKEATQK